MNPAPHSLAGGEGEGGHQEKEGEVDGETGFDEAERSMCGETDGVIH